MMTGNNGAKRSVCRMRLFLAGNSTNSRIARQNLEQLQTRVQGCSFEVEIVDVTEDSRTALENEIYLTPALQILEPGPRTTVFGNLSDSRTLEKLLSGKGL